MRKEIFIYFGEDLFSRPLPGDNLIGYSLPLTTRGLPRIEFAIQAVSRPLSGVMKGPRYGYSS